MRTGKLAATVALLTLCAQAICTAQQLPRPCAAAAKPYLAVLVWHDVVGKKTVWFDTYTSVFDKQIAEIRAGHFHVITLQQLLNHLIHGAPVPSRPIMIAFDDNNQGIYRNAFPVLLKYHLPFTLFVHTAYVGVTTDKRHNTWAMLKTMQKSGLATVESLTASHPENIRLLNNAQIMRELAVSRRSIQVHLNTPVDAFVYPCNVHDLRVATDVYKGGYTAAFTEDWGNAGTSPDMMDIHRYPAILRFTQALQDVARGYAR